MLRRLGTKLPIAIAIVIAIMLCECRDA